MFKVVFTNVVIWLFLFLFLDHTCYLLTSEALPDGALPKGGGWTTSGADDDTEIETYTTSEHEVYERVLYPKKNSPLINGSRIDRTIHQKSAAYNQRTGKLFSRNRLVLRIHLNGVVDGTTDENSPLVDLEFHSIGAGLLMILGVSSGRYLTISDTGLLYGSVEPTLNSVFREVQEENLYHSYLSYKHEKSQWLVAIKRNGKAKKATQTMIGQKSTQFILEFT